MLTKNVHYADRPDRVIVTTCGSTSLVEFPIDITEITIEGDEPRKEYIAESVYSLKTTSTPNLKERVEAHYYDWLDTAKTPSVPHTTLEDVVEAVNVLQAMIIGGEL